MQNTGPIAEAGDLVQLAGPRQITITAMLKPGARIESTYGILQHDELIGLSWGSQVSSHTGKSFVLLQPALDDLLRSIRRNTQIMYPKDIGYVLVSLGIGPSQEVIEAGTGSGALTIALAHAVGPEGRVYSYERRAETMKMARSNLEGLGLANRVSFKVRDIVEGFDERAMRAVYLDLPNPEDYLPQVQAALQPGGFFGCILPTANQVSLLIASLEKSGFAMLEVSEMLHRYYNTEAGRFRPADSMVAHTGYLVFARRLGAILRKARGRR